MQSYIFPKLLRSGLHPDCENDPAVRSQKVNAALLRLSASELTRMGMRRSRQTPKTPYEPFLIAVTDDAIHVLRSLPPTVSRSALIQNILR